MLYETALLQHRREIAPLITPLLTVDAKSIPEWYATLFSLPWHKCYTLNIDDLDIAVSGAHDLPRKIIASSGMSGKAELKGGNVLEVVHLNGVLADIPDNVTFSATQYVERLAGEDPVYLQLAAELLSHPFVFVGTTLDEPPLWQHVQLRFSKGRKMREFRPHSYLLTPSLDKPREAYLSQFNIDWIACTAEEFAKDTLPGLATAAKAGITFLSASADKGSLARIPEISQLAIDPREKTEFLLGSEPIWADIQSGRAIERECDKDICDRFTTELKTRGKKCFFIVTGTAGSGKSTSLMRVALDLSNQGKRVGWIDRNTSISPRAIRMELNSEDLPDAIFIDDADIYGAELSPLIRDVVLSTSKPLLAIGIRSGRIDKALNPAQLNGISNAECVMPHLADDDIEDLINALDRENRLGRLKGLPLHEQIAVFREQAGRQLLVAMIQATSGVKFEDKATAEFGDLRGDAQAIYGLLCVATYLGFNLSRSEILVALGDASNETLNALDELVRRHIVVLNADQQTYRARHRVIADIIFKRLQSEGALYEILSGLAKIAATEVRPGMPRSTRPMRLLIRVINHDLLHRCLGISRARNLYDELESQLKEEAHFWLQRASLELEDGFISLAENFIHQARGIAPEDALIEITFAHFLFQKALEHPGEVDSPDLVATAAGILKAAIAKRGQTDSHPYHILGSQGLAWSRRGLDTFEKKRDYLQNLNMVMAEARTKHPRDEMIGSLFNAVNNEYLNLAVRA